MIQKIIDRWFAKKSTSELSKVRYLLALRNAVETIDQSAQFVKALSPQIASPEALINPFDAENSREKDMHKVFENFRQELIDSRTEKVV